MSLTPLHFAELTTAEEIPAKTIIVNEGDICNKILFIKKGCIRAYYNTDGKEVTLQFFFEGDSVTSLESFLNNVPSLITLETLETCQVSLIDNVAFLNLIERDNSVKDWFYKTAIEKLFIHTNRLCSLLNIKPFERYQLLLNEKPELFQRIPQHYIASYLGITAVSLSRIRNR